ncbi:hypothetical protein CKAH01_05972 [Colletotrichum kahawae]|uniref:Heterokaryon incompatibility domain-containing protein n=1 Tax=Colletotrichum kahawae TaxID=34407 RepID=A0AAD9YDN8_COLKA|nr:hypothetical protein CKAH01_05972 [Colletotrichum kahawae]
MEAHSATAPVIEALMSRSFDIERKDAEGMTLLAYAAFYGHSEMISHLLAKNAKVDAETNLGFQPLHLAAQYGYIQAIQVLVEAGADINAKTHRGDTAVLIAARRDYQDVVYFLGKNGADLIAVGEYSYNALHHATKNDNKLLLDFLVSQEVPVDVKAVFGWTPLMTAARHANSGTTLFLIEHGADVNTTDDNGWRPLHVAALRGHRVIVEKLLENGADPFAETKDGHRAEFICRQAEEDPSFQRYLAPQEKSRRSDLDSERILHVLQEKTAASLNAQPEEKRKSIAILVACAGRGQVDRVAKLLDEGCDVNGRDFNGRTATSMAAENGKDSILQLLIQRGADVNLPDADMEHDADLNHLADALRTPLHIAASSGDTVVVEALLLAGSRTDIKDDDGRTAVSYAKEYSHEPVVKLFSSARYLHREIPGNLQHSGRNIKHFKPSYEYQRLKRETSIRILRLHPGKSDDVLSFDLTEADLDRKPSFEALSYEWRGKVGSIPVLCNNQQLLITPNCKAAMQTLRRESTFRNLWIDALCINQEDYSEKAKQVALMTRIYGIAEKVLMWLGSGCLNTNAAFDEMAEMAEMADLSRSLSHDEQGAMAMERASGILRKTNVLAGFRELEESQYFTRAWIFQEVVLGQSRGLIMCGKCQCSWEVFQYAMETFQEHEVEHRRSTRPWPRQIAGCIANFEQNGRLSLPEALDMMSYLSAGDPRDKIFAALGVTKLEDQGMGVSTPFPDYQVFDWAVFVDTTRYLIHDSGSMHFWYLGCRRGLKPMAKLPSWVPEFKRDDKAPLWSAHGIRTVRFASILRGQPSTRLSPDMSSLNELLASSRPSTTFSSLYVTACFVDKVVFCLEDDSDDDVYSLVLSAAKELARRGGSIYDPYTGLNAEDAPNEGRSQTARLPVGGCDSEMTHLDALLVTILAVEDEDVRKLWDIWTQEPPLGQFEEGMRYWTEREKTYLDFDLAVCKLLADTLDRGDLIYTENGRFGLATRGEAKEGLMVALLSGSTEMSLLERKEGSTWYEYVDEVF